MSFIEINVLLKQDWKLKYIAAFHYFFIVKCFSFPLVFSVVFFELSGG